jgi:allantoinase
MEPTRYGPFAYSPIIDRPAWKWPNGAQLAVWVIPNIEFYPLNVDYHLGIPGGKAIQPNILEWSRRDYGNRVGVYRLMDVLGERQIRATVALNSDICNDHPRIIEKCVELKWELMGHCDSNINLLSDIPVETEGRIITNTLSTIEKVSGKRPVGWLGAGLTETWNTLELLSAQGVRYVADFVNDDQPYLMKVGRPPLVSIPYTIELNDTQQINRRNLSGVAFGDLIRDQFEVLYQEGASSARVMAIALHPWISGVPHTVRALGRTLDLLASHKGVWFATGSEIVDAFLQATQRGAVAGLGRHERDV